MGQANSNQKTDKLSKPQIVQPENGESVNIDCRPRRKSKATPPQDRRQKWRKNYMMMSLPCQADDVIRLNSLKRADFHSFTQSLNRQTSRQLKRERHKERLLKLLRDCAESMEGIVSKSYVESMKSCVNLDSSSSDYTSNYDSSHDLIVLDDDVNAGTQSLPANTTQMVNTSKSRAPKADSKNLSEIVFREHDDGDVWAELGGGEVLYMSTDNPSKRYVTPKLRLANSFCSSYVEDSDFSYTPSEEGLVAHYPSVASKGWVAASPLVNRNSKHSKLNEDEYRDLVCNGKSTAFLSHHEDEMSLYYDDEFDMDKSPPGAALHDSDLEAAICNEYASLLHKANTTMHFNTQSIHSTNAHSNFSSDFDNIFPTSLSLNGDIDITALEGVATTEEILELDESVPNYSDIPASTKKDYQLTFAHGESLYSDARSSCDTLSTDSDLSEDEGERYVGDEKCKPSSVHNQIPKPPRVKYRDQAHCDVTHVSAKKVSFSDELAIVDENDKTHAQKMEEIGNSTTWLQMKQNYTTWGQVKCDRTERDCKKSKSVPDIRTEAKTTMDNHTEYETDQKRYSLTLWEQYKRTHSLTLGVVGQGELTTPEAFSEPTVSELDQTQGQHGSKAAQELAESINNLLDDALLGPHYVKKAGVAKTSTIKFNLPDLSFLRTNKTSLSEYKWWKEIFDQPSFCTTPGASRGGSCAASCSHCERKHSTDHHVILFQGSKPAQYKICELSMLEQLLSTPSSQCQCTKEKLCDLSSGIATGSSGVTPREPSSWQHIADFLKRRQKQDGGSRGSLNSTLSDQQLLDVVACIESADILVKHQQTGFTQQTQSHGQQDLLLQIWKFVSALECVLSTGLKSHKLVNVTMGKIRARVSIWDIVEESSLSAGKLTNVFSQIINEVSRYQLNDPSMKFCLFIVGALNYQCLDFWLSILTHNTQLMDKFYHDDAYLRSKVIGDRKLHSEMLQSVQPLSLFTWDVNYKNMISACTIPHNATTTASESGANGNHSLPVKCANTTWDKAQREPWKGIPFYRQSPTSNTPLNQQRTHPNLSKTHRYYSANNIGQAVLI